MAYENPSAGACSAEPLQASPRPQPEPPALHEVYVDRHPECTWLLPQQLCIICFADAGPCSPAVIKEHWYRMTRSYPMFGPE